MTENDIIDTQAPKKNYLQEDTFEKTDPSPQYESAEYKPADKLKGKVAIITGADSGIGAAVAIAFAKEGAHIIATDYDNQEDAKKLKKRIREISGNILWLTGDVGDENFVQEVVDKTIQEYGHIDILVNNAAEQHNHESISEITAAQLDRTFRTNIFSMFYFVKAALPYMKKNSKIINTASVTAYKGSPELLDYSSTKGAIVSFTRSLSQNKEILDKEIRVNAVAPGPIWTPLIQSTIPNENKEKFGSSVPMKRTGEAYELAPSYVYLACEDSSYVSGQVLHVNGGTVING
ncbi:glucose 1-dehydrogenase [Carnobacterium sp.]|uniref:glucose 1-dehydrogenase n=1 Tax=Carnobacterium sp. TaxID=48221 RepID=UPI003C73A9DC